MSPPLPSGLCLEKVPAASPSLSNKNTSSPMSNRKTVDREQEIIICYEKSGDIALLYLQEAEKVCLVQSDERNWHLSFITSQLQISWLTAGLTGALPSLSVCDEDWFLTNFDECITANESKLTNNSLPLFYFEECPRGNMA